MAYLPFRLRLMPSYLCAEPYTILFFQFFFFSLRDCFNRPLPGEDGHNGVKISYKLLEDQATKKKKNHLFQYSFCPFFFFFQYSFYLFFLSIISFSLSFQLFWSFYYCLLCLSLIIVYFTHNNNNNNNNNKN